MKYQIGNMILLLDKNPKSKCYGMYLTGILTRFMHGLNGIEAEVVQFNNIYPNGRDYLSTWSAEEVIDKIENLSRLEKVLYDVD